MTRKEEVAMIGGGNLKNWPWTKARTVVMLTFLGLGGLMMTLGIIFWPNGFAQGGVVCGVIMITIALIATLCDYFYGQLPYRIVIGFPKLEVIEFDPIERVVTVVGADKDKHYFKPDATLYSDKEEKSYVVVSGQLDYLWLRLRLGRDVREVVSLPNPEKAK